MGDATMRAASPPPESSKPAGGGVRLPPAAGSIEEYAETALAVGWPGATGQIRRWAGQGKRGIQIWES